MYPNTFENDTKAELDTIKDFLKHPAIKKRVLVRWVNYAWVYRSHGGKNPYWECIIMLKSSHAS
jgi:phage pi2 protein 07